MERGQWKILSSIIADDTLTSNERIKKVKRKLGGRRIWIPPLSTEKSWWGILSEIIADDTIRGEERTRKIRQKLGRNFIRIPPLHYEERDKIIREQKAMGKTITAIAREFNLSVDRVKEIIYKTYKTQN